MALRPRRAVAALLAVLVAHHSAIVCVGQADDDDILGKELQDKEGLMGHVSDNVQIGAQDDVYDRLEQDSHDLRDFAKWTEPQAATLTRTTYASLLSPSSASASSSSLSSPPTDSGERVWEEVEAAGSELSEKAQREWGMVGEGEVVDDKNAPDDNDIDNRKKTYGEAMAHTQSAISSRLSEANKGLEQIADLANVAPPLLNATQVQESLGLDDVALASTAMALDGFGHMNQLDPTSSAPDPESPSPSSLSSSASSGTGSSSFTPPLFPPALTALQPASGSLSSSTAASAMAGNDIGRAIGSTLAMATASTLPVLGRGALKKYGLMTRDESGLLTHDAPSPHQPIEAAIGKASPCLPRCGFTPEYYAALASAKDIPMWWSHSGAHVAPPWFTSNAPPSRAHLGRASVNVPSPPFLDSPYRSTILDYWKGKRPRFLPPTPKPWPFHHPMAGPWNGDGSLRCPCPHAPQLLCDCQAIEFDASDVWQKGKTAEQGMDPTTPVKDFITHGLKRTASTLMKAPYPEMALMSLMM